MALELENCILPPQHTIQSFAAAVQDFRNALGVEHVTIIDSTQLDDQSYHNPPKTHDPFHILDQTEFVGSLVIRPGSTEEVQAVLRLCNKHRVPVWPVSIGRNFGYGGAAPRMRGTIVLDLGDRMNKVLEINESQAFALLEPGVTYQALYDELRRRGSTLWIDSTDLGAGSVLGNITERGVGYTPLGDHFMNHCGMEVVLPSGEVVRTGMGGVRDKNSHHGSANTWQLFQYGFGPYHDGIFSQSNYGIVTKVGVWLMPDPGGCQSYMISLEKDSDLHAAIEIIRPLRIAGIIQNVPSLRNATLDIAAAGPRTKFTNSGKPLEEEEIDAAIKDLTIGRWSFYGALYGPEPIRNVLWDAIKGAFSKIPGVKFYFPSDVPETEVSVLRIRDELFRGIPSIKSLEWTNWLPNGSIFFLSPICPVTGDDAMLECGLAKKRFREFGFDYISTLTIGMREMHHVIIVIFNRHDAEEKARAMQMLRKIVDDCTEVGHGEYRTHLALMDHVGKKYDWNNGAIMKLNEQLKDALDPNGILAPGKSGIWPKVYRDQKHALSRETMG